MLVDVMLKGMFVYYAFIIYCYNANLIKNKWETTNYITNMGCGAVVE